MARKDQKKGNARLTAALFGLAVFACIVFVVIDNNDGSVQQAIADGQAGMQAAQANGEVQRPFSGSGYVLAFGEDFKAGMNSVDDLGMSVVIAMDTSGSMADPPSSGEKKPKYLQAAQALGQIVDFLEKNLSGQAANGLLLKVGIVGFADKTQELFPLTAMDKAGFAKLRQALSDPSFFDPGGKTAMGAAMQEGARILAQSGTILKSLIVVTDGENNLDPDPLQVLTAINQNRNDASTVDNPVFTQGMLVSFVGFDIDAGTFSDLHSEGGRVTSAADQTELQTALQQILVADITRLEAAGTPSR